MTVYQQNLDEDEENSMEKIIKTIGLKKEAILLDSWLYILKSMLAIGTGYLVGSIFAVTRLDMISVLLGVMYNLQATNVTAVKGGVNQMLASFMGAATTGILVYFFGPTLFTIIFGMGLTLFIALKIDYKAVSPVAIFTSIYMTQFIQKDMLGNPSIFLTIRLRMLALGLGVLIAIIFNFIFSFLYFRNMTFKRLEFMKLSSLDALKLTKNYLLEDKTESGIDYNKVFSGVFSNIDSVIGNIQTMSKEPMMHFSEKERTNLDVLSKMADSMKIMVHLAYDACFTKDEFKFTLKKEEISSLEELIHSLEKFSFLGIRESLKKPSQEYRPQMARVEGIGEVSKQRALDDLNLLSHEYQKILHGVTDIVS